MIYKQRKKNIEIEGLIALEKRLRKGDENRAKIEDRLYILNAGYGGETQYDKYLTEFKPDYPHAILHDVTLCVDNIFFQMDSILITPALIVISEVKNIAEKIIVKSKPLQFIKEFPTGKRLPLRNPVVEVERKKYHLKCWLKKREIEIPIKGIIAFAYNNELLIEEPPSIDIMFTYEVAAYLRSLPMNTEILSESKIHLLAKAIAKQHNEFNPFPLLKRYNIPFENILPGVICSTCNSLQMRWSRKKWNCLQCGQGEKDAHENALMEWKMLVKDNITNKEFRDFTQLEDRHTATKLLKRSPIKLHGRGRLSKYELTFEQSPRSKVNKI